MEFQEEEILTACALRFDGYKYCDEAGFDYNKALDDYFASERWDIAPLEQLATFFMLQKGLCKWNLVYEPQDGKYWKAFRELFLLTCKHEVPKVYQQQPYCRTWRERFAQHLPALVEHIKNIHRNTQYVIVGSTSLRQNG